MQPLVYSCGVNRLASYVLVMQASSLSRVPSSLGTRGSTFLFPLVSPWHVVVPSPGLVKGGGVVRIHTRLSRYKVREDSRDR